MAFSELPPRAKKFAAGETCERSELPSTPDTVSNRHLAVSVWSALTPVRSIFGFSEESGSAQQIGREPIIRLLFGVENKGQSTLCAGTRFDRYSRALFAGECVREKNNLQHRRTLRGLYPFNSLLVPQTLNAHASTPIWSIWSSQDFNGLQSGAYARDSTPASPPKFHKFF